MSESVTKKLPDPAASQQL